MKLWGCMLLMAACIGGGYCGAANLKKRSIHLRLLIQMITDMINQLRYQLPTVSELLHHLHMQKCYGDLPFLENCLQSDPTDVFSQRWADAIRCCRYPEEEQAVLLQIGEILGSTDVEGQCSTLLLCRDHLESLLKQAEEKQHSHSTLYRSMGVLSGLFLVILLI